MGQILESLLNIQKQNEKCEHFFYAASEIDWKLFSISLMNAYSTFNDEKTKRINKNESASSILNKCNIEKSICYRRKQQHHSLHFT